MIRTIPGVALIVMAISLAAAGQAPLEARKAISGFDPVELTEGRQVEGRPDVAVTRNGYRYLFASERSRDTFLASPERFEIQFGGACMRMGPLSGAGSPDRFVVHDGHIYLFASDSCKARFLERPEAFVDSADREVEGDETSRRSAKRYLELAVRAVGGADRLRSLYRVEYLSTVRSGNGAEATEHTRREMLQFPSTFEREDDYGKTRGGWRVSADQGWHLHAPDTPVVASVRDYMIRLAHRQPLVILKSWMDGQAKAVSLGREMAGNTAIERVAVSTHGATTTLSIDASTGHIVKVSHRGRSVNGIGQFERSYGGFRTVQGLVVPFDVVLSVDGTVVAEPQVKLTGVKVEFR